MTLFFVKFIEPVSFWSSSCQFFVKSESASILMKSSTMTN